MRKLIPIFLIVICLVLLVGCFYVPTFEQLDQSDVKGKDVRKLAGGSDGNAPLHTGRTTRVQVLALLGPPTYASSDSRSIGYTSESLQGYWVYPLCFSASPSATNVYVLRLNFDDQDILQSFAIGSSASDIGWFLIVANHMDETDRALAAALAKVNASGPKLLPVKKTE